MLGHVFWDEGFTRKFLNILEKEYDDPETAPKLWETIYLAHLDELRMKVRKYPSDRIFEFDTLDELRTFDPSYINDTRSELLKKTARELGVSESELVNIKAVKGEGLLPLGFEFECGGEVYRYIYETDRLK